MNIRKFPSGAIMTNSYLVTDGTGHGFIVDAGAYNRQLAEAVKSEGIEPLWLILTHGHGDHIGGVKAYLDEFKGCRLAAGEGERPILSDPKANYTGEIFGREFTLEPDLWLKDGDVIEAGEMRLEIIATPGHTPGGISILVGDALFSGDTLFRDSIGRTDLAGGSFDALIASIRDRLFALPDDVAVYPGHMDATSIGHEKKHNPFL
ncbi:MAG: MBL fold metallo-hydrolase [Clostridiales Family XIII bacterium]|jgi:glyoxylase-like metal-dependent hydrolase (beta-lactamase superfamily II)|nr:MBL fold metallo-hydrolase [Clostridiales Family XIII bacterium]